MQHAKRCGGDTGIFLVLKTSMVLLLRGDRKCIWGSPYLDAFGEEDGELKRGKPLFLNSSRYQTLNTLWLTHRFDHDTRIQNAWQHIPEAQDGV
jgi:E3 ubiquitin-protein ligase UBR3